MSVSLRFHGSFRNRQPLFEIAFLLVEEGERKILECVERLSSVSYRNAAVVAADRDIKRAVLSSTVARDTSPMRESVPLKNSAILSATESLTVTLTFALEKSPPFETTSTSTLSLIHPAPPTPSRLRDRRTKLVFLLIFHLTPIFCNSACSLSALIDEFCDKIESELEQNRA